MTIEFSSFPLQNQTRCGTLLRHSALYEPIHGTAPSLAGKDIANPLATILSAALLLRYSLGLTGEAIAVEEAVVTVLEQGYRTADIAEKDKTIIGTREMGERVATLVAGGAAA